MLYLAYVVWPQFELNQNFVPLVPWYYVPAFEYQLPIGNCDPTPANETLCGKINFEL